MTDVRHGKWTLRYDLPYREVAYVGVHDDYDGAPTYSDGPPGDSRCFYGPTVEDVLEQIRDYEDVNTVEHKRDTDLFTKGAV